MTGKTGSPNTGCVALPAGLLPNSQLHGAGDSHTVCHRVPEARLVSETPRSEMVRQDSEMHSLFKTQFAFSAW